MLCASLGSCQASSRPARGGLGRSDLRRSACWRGRCRGSPLRRRRTLRLSRVASCRGRGRRTSRRPPPQPASRSDDARIVSAAGDRAPAPPPWPVQRRDERREHPVGEQAEAAEVGEARALAEARQARDVEARLHPLERQGAVEAQLGLRLAVPDRPHPRLQFGPHRLGEEPAQLRQQVEAGAVDDVVVAATVRGAGRRSPSDSSTPLVRGARVDRARRARTAALLPRQPRDHGRVEDAAVAVLDEVPPRLQVELRPVDVVGVGEDAVLEEALAAAQRQGRRVDGDLRLAAAAPAGRPAPRARSRRRRRSPRRPRGRRAGGRTRRAASRSGGRAARPPGRAGRRGGRRGRSAAAPARQAASARRPRRPRPRSPSARCAASSVTATTRPRSVVTPSVARSSTQPR